MSYESKKCSSLAPPRGIFYKTQCAWQGVKLTRLMSIFTSKKVWKCLIKITYEYNQLKYSFILFHSEVLEPHLLPFIQGHPARDRIVFQQDGARCHNARVTTQWLEANLNARMICSLQSQQDQRIGRQPFLFEWPPYSPDMTPMDFGNNFKLNFFLD